MVMNKCLSACQAEHAQACLAKGSDGHDQVGSKANARVQSQCKCVQASHPSVAARPNGFLA